MAEKIYKNETVERVLNALKGNVTWSNAESVATYYYKLAKIAEEIELRGEEPKRLLLKFGETIFIPEYHDKVKFQEGRDQTKINAKKLAQFLIENNRVLDLFSVVSVSEKILKEKLDDAEFLIAKFKEITGSTKPSISVTSMTKDEVKKLHG